MVDLEATEEIKDMKVLGENLVESDCLAPSLDLLVDY